METWYVMEDGRCCDPREIATGADGKLRHKDGRTVAYREDGETPRARGVDAAAERAKASSSNQKDMKPKPNNPGKGYSTRESKAD